MYRHMNALKALQEAQNRDTPPPTSLNSLPTPSPPQPAFTAPISTSASSSQPRTEQTGSQTFGAGPSHEQGLDSNIDDYSWWTDSHTFNATDLDDAPSPEAEPQVDPQFDDLAQTRDNGSLGSSSNEDDEDVTRENHEADETDPSLLDELTAAAKLQDLQLCLAFIRALENADLDDPDSQLLPSTVERLLERPITRHLRIDEDARLGIDSFIATLNASQETYNGFRGALDRHSSTASIPSYAQLRQDIADLTGVHSVVHDMCINSCLAYTGPHAVEESCPICKEPRYDSAQLASSGGRIKVARQQFHTIPIGPQLQALWRSPKHGMGYRRTRTQQVRAELEANRGKVQSWDDIYSGTEYLAACDRGDITADAMVLTVSMDGAQLYEKKTSDCWIYAWVVMDLPPDVRYKKRHILPGGIIPGPNGPGMAMLDGLVGHTGRYGCRLYCPQKGCHKPQRGCYYPAHLLPDNYTVADCNQEDISPWTATAPSEAHYIANLQYLTSSRTTTQYKQRRLETGIVKPTIFLGFRPENRFPIPSCFPANIMHHMSLNIPDLFFELWRGTLDCEYPDSKDTWDFAVFRSQASPAHRERWITHGENVANARPYLPGSFDRPPRNPAEKINSGYKAWEFLNYLVGLGPGVFYNVLPDGYYKNFCKLIFGMRIAHQRRITREQLVAAHISLMEFITEYEAIYYRRRVERLHFVRQSIHQLVHVCHQIEKVGPAAVTSQWPLERTIGNLGQEIRQPSNPFANLSQRAILRCQINSLMVLVPGLSPSKEG
ncbi:hypothetical protein SISSUDRAFT_1038391, partial [Sistotremastrum suecicum HHB10207 ss-3]